MPGRAPKVTVSEQLKKYYDTNFYPDKLQYPPRPSERGDTDIFATYYKPKGKSSDNDEEENPWGLTGNYADQDMYAKDNAASPTVDPYSYDTSRSYRSRGSGDTVCGIIVSLLILGVLIGYMFLNMLVFWHTGLTDNWLTCLAWGLLGLPAITIVACIIIYALGKNAGDQHILCFPTTLEECGEHSFVIGIVGFAFFLAVGIPYSMYNGQLRAIQHYLNPNRTLDLSCYNGRQPLYQHGKTHFVFLQERDWEFNCSNSGVSRSGRAVATAPKYARLGTEGQHYFYMTNLYYIGDAQWNCPHPIFAVCYKESGTIQTCDALLEDVNCWAGPPVGISLRVMNQNEQFFRNWMDENDSEAEAHIRSKILAAQYTAPWRDSGPIVTYGGDHPADFDAKEDKVRNTIRNIEICIYVIWPVLILYWFIDSECTAFMFVLLCIAEIC